MPFAVCVSPLVRSGLSSHSLDIIFFPRVVLNFNKALSAFSLMNCAFGVVYKKVSPYPRSSRFFLLSSRVL